MWEEKKELTNEETAKSALTDTELEKISGGDLNAEDGLNLDNPDHDKPKTIIKQ